MVAGRRGRGVASRTSTENNVGPNLCLTDGGVHLKRLYEHLLLPLLLRLLRAEPDEEHSWSNPSGCSARQLLASLCSHNICFASSPTVRVCFYFHFKYFFLK